MDVVVCQQEEWWVDEWWCCCWLVEKDAGKNTNYHTLGNSNGTKEK